MGIDGFSGCVIVCSASLPHTGGGPHVIVASAIHVLTLDLGDVLKYVDLIPDKAIICHPTQGFMSWMDAKESQVGMCHGTVLLLSKTQFHILNSSCLFFLYTAPSTQTEFSPWSLANSMLAEGVHTVEEQLWRSTFNVQLFARSLVPNHPGMESKCLGWLSC